MLLILNRPRELTEQCKNTCMGIHISQATGLKFDFFQNFQLVPDVQFQLSSIGNEGSRHVDGDAIRHRFWRDRWKLRPHMLLSSWWPLQIIWYRLFVWWRTFLFVCVHKHTCWVWLSFFSEVWLSVLKKCSVSTTASSLKIARQNKRTNCYSENVTNKGTTHLDCSWIHAAHKHDISRTSSRCSLLSFISIIKLTKDTYFQSCHCARVIDLSTLCDMLVKTLGDLNLIFPATM